MDYAFTEWTKWLIPAAATVLLVGELACWHWSARRTCGALDVKRPVLYRELRALLRPKAKLRWLIWISIGGTLLYATVATYVVFSLYGDVMDTEYLPPAAAGIVNFLSFVFLPALTATAIAREAEQQTLDLLLVTPLSARAIVTDKLLAVLWFFGLVYLLPLGLPLLLCIPVPEHWGMAVLGLFNCAATAFCIGALGLFFSACFRKTGAAIAAAYGAIVFGHIVLSALGMALAFWVSNGAEIAIVGVEMGTTVLFEWFAPVIYLVFYYVIARLALDGAAKLLARQRG